MVVFIVIAVLLRLATVALSLRNERRLKAEGAVEHGAANSTVLALSHVAFYLAAIAEWVWRDPPFDIVSGLGLVLFAFGMAMLAVVVALLGRFWTVKVLIARDHVLVTHPLFRLVRHPNYVLNILPELIGLALALHAYVTLVVGLPAYLVVLWMRVRIEERAMRASFPAYSR